MSTLSSTTSSNNGLLMGRMSRTRFSCESTGHCLRKTHSRACLGFDHAGCSAGPSVNMEGVFVFLLAFIYSRSREMNEVLYGHLAGSDLASVMIDLVLGLLSYVPFLLARAGATKRYTSFIQHIRLAQLTHWLVITRSSVVKFCALICKTRSVSVLSAGRR